MTPIEAFLADPDDPEAVRRLVDLKPKERKAALAELGEFEASERAKVEGLDYEWKLEKLAQDTPGRADGLARWKAYDEARRRIWLARTACHLGTRTVPKDMIEAGSLLHPPILERVIEAPPAWLPLAYEKVQKRFERGLNELIDRLVAAGHMPSPPADSDYHRAWHARIHRMVGGDAAAAACWFREHEGFLENQACRWLQSCVTKEAVAFNFSGVLTDEFRDALFRRESGERISFPQLLMEVATPEQRLMLGRALLEAFRDCTSDHVASRAVAMWDVLEMKPDERLALQDALCAVLGSPAAPAVKFFCQVVSGIAADPGFDPGQLAAHLPAALLHSSKPTRKAALDLARLTQKHHSDSAALAPALVAAAADTDPALRSAFVALVKASPAEARTALAGPLTPLLSEVPAATRKELEELVGVEGEPSVTPPQVSAAGPLKIAFPPTKPAAGVDDVAHLAAGLLVDVPEPLDLELLIDGLLRFGASAEVAAALDPLVKRARHYHEGFAESRGNFSTVTILAAEWILCFSSEGRPEPAWILRPSDQPEAARKETRTRACEPLGVLAFLIDLFGELLDAAAAGRSTGLLCAPEFEDGSIAPATLVARFGALRVAGEKPTHRELILALARANPSEPCDAEIVGDDEAAQVLRYLLTGRRPSAIATPAWWLAAARARDPHGDFSSDPLFAPFDDEQEADWTRPAKYRPLSEGACYWDLAATSGLLADVPHDPPSDRLFPLQHRHHLGNGPGNWTPEIRWRYCLTPHHLDGVILQDLLHLSDEAGYSYKTGEHAANAVASEVAARRPPLHHSMRVLLLRTMSCSKPRLRMVGIDLAHDAIEDGRLGSVIAELGDLLRIMMGICAPGVVFADPDVRHLAASLRELAGRSPLARAQVRALLAAGLNEPPAKMPKALPALLELAFELFEEEPPSNLPDFVTNWPDLPPGKPKALAKKIAALKSARPNA